MMIESLRRLDLIIATRLLMPGIVSIMTLDGARDTIKPDYLLSTPAMRELIPDIVER